MPGIIHELLQSLSDKAYEHSSEGLSAFDPRARGLLLSGKVSPHLDLQMYHALKGDAKGPFNDALRLWRDISPDTLEAALRSQGYTDRQAAAEVSGAASVQHPLYRAAEFITPEDLQAHGESAALKGIGAGALGGGVLGAVGGTAARQVGKRQQRKKKASISDWINQLVDHLSSGEQEAAGGRSRVWAYETYDPDKAWKFPEDYQPLVDQARKSFGPDFYNVLNKVRNATGAIAPTEYLKERLAGLVGGYAGEGTAHNLIDPETGELRTDLHWRDESADTIKNMTRMGLGTGVAGGGVAGLLAAYGMPKAVNALRGVYREGKGHEKSSAILDPFFDWVGAGGADLAGHVVGERAPLIPWAMRHFPGYAGMKILETGAQLLPPAFLTGTIGYGLGKKIIGGPSKTLLKGLKEKIKHRVKQSSSNILQDILPDAFQGVDQDALGAAASDISRQAEASGMVPPPSMMPNSRELALVGILAPMSAGASGTLLMKKLMDMRKAKRQ